MRMTGIFRTECSWILTLSLFLMMAGMAERVAAQTGTGGSAAEAAIREAINTQDRYGRDTGRRASLQVDNIRIAGNWATCGHGDGEYEGSAILRRVGGRWRVVVSDGGSVGGLLFRYGVPRELWARFAAHPVLMAENERMARAGLIPTSAVRALTESDMRGLTARQLTLARNTIFARHGRSFRDSELRGYFDAQDWYQPDEHYSDDRLTPLEVRNAQFILAFQEKRGLGW